MRACLNSLRARPLDYASSGHVSFTSHHTAPGAVQKPQMGSAHIFKNAFRATVEST